MSTAETAFYDLLNKGSETKPTAPTEGSLAEKFVLEGDPDASKPVTIRTLFTHHDTHPVVIDLAMLKTFGVEWFMWDQSTVWSEVKRLFKTEISEHARTKIQTVRTLHVTSLPWEKWQVFEKIIQGLNNNIPLWETMQAPTLPQLYTGFDIMETVRRADFSDEVKLYMAAAVLHEEVHFVPPPLDFLQLEISHPHYKCLDCGNEDSALYHDGTCDTCTKKYDTEQGLSMKPNQELLAKGIGKNLELVVRHDHDEVEKRWNDVKGKATNSVDMQETPEDVQVAKLLVARDLMNVRRKQLADQLTNLKSWLGTE